jgi:hypothetical protein
MSDECIELLIKHGKENMIGEATYKALLKIYTHDALFVPISKQFCKGKPDSIHGYLTPLLFNHMKFGDRFMYTAHDQPVYVGIAP